MEFRRWLIFIKTAEKIMIIKMYCDDKNNWAIYNTKMHPLRISQLVLEIINNNRNAFKLILNGLENSIITKNKQKETVIFFKNYINELPASLF